MDWRVVEFPSGGILTVTILWDTPTIHASVEAVSSYGVSLKRMTRDPKTEADLITLEVEEAGFVFVKCAAEEGRSDYALKAEFFPSAL